MVKSTFSVPIPGQARPLHEPLTPPHRPPCVPRRKINVTLDQERYVAFKAFAAMHGLSGDNVAVIAIDRLLAND